MKQPIAQHGKHHDILVEDHWVRIRVQPNTVVTNDLILSMLNELYSLEAYRSEKAAGLWDFSGCKSDLNYETLHEIKDYIALHYDSDWSHTYTAIVADGDLIYSLSRMYEIMTDDVPTITQTFRKIDDAEKWLIEKMA